MGLYMYAGTVAAAECIIVDVQTGVVVNRHQQELDSGCVRRNNHVKCAKTLTHNVVVSSSVLALSCTPDSQRDVASLHIADWLAGWLAS